MLTTCCQDLFTANVDVDVIERTSDGCDKVAVEDRAKKLVSDCQYFKRALKDSLGD
jgi:hypothetical protein